jgi:hypothetical protein
MDIIRRMYDGPKNAELSGVAALRGCGAGLCVAALGLTAVTLACLGEEARRQTGITGNVTEAAVLAIPLAAVTFIAAPAVTSPKQSVSRFALEPLPLIAIVVSIRLLDEVVLSRLGGRHGP